MSLHSNETGLISIKYLLISFMNNILFILNLLKLNYNVTVVERFRIYNKN